MDRYQYHPLSPERREIRLIILHRLGLSESQELRVSIVAVDFENPTQVPAYSALSYVWGDPNDRCDLLVVPWHGDQDNLPPGSRKRLSVTRNLVTALTYIRGHHSRLNQFGSPMFWVDAICINQDDMDERAAQVRCMAQIYASAQLVYGWVGPPTHDSNVAMHFLHLIGDSIEVDWTSLAIRPKEEPKLAGLFAGADQFSQFLLGDSWPMPWNMPPVMALDKFLDRPWFERLWIRQEITLGGDRGLLMCGDSSIGWKEFQKVGLLLGRKPVDPEHPRRAHVIDRYYHIMQMCIHNKSWLGHLMRQMHWAKCTDPRDRVYGILGILPPKLASLADTIVPDYHKSVVEVYKDLVLGEMAVTKRADLLTECTMSPDPASTWKPSWVPSWSAKDIATKTQMHQCADGQSVVDAVCLGKDSLQVKGVLVPATVVDVVQFPNLKGSDPFISDSGNDGQGTPAYVAFIQNLAKKLNLSNNAPYRPAARSSVVEALCYALSDGGYAKEHLSEHSRRPDTMSIARLKYFFRYALDFSDTDMKSDALKPGDPAREIILDGVGAMARFHDKNTLIITKEGHIGLGPIAAQPGDQLAIVLGCMRALLLRSQTSSKAIVEATDAISRKVSRQQQPHNEFRIVGSCSVHGLNWGETVLGPLPQNTTLIWSDKADIGEMDPAFRIGDMKQETVHDPRMTWDLLKTDTRQGALWVKQATAAEYIFTGQTALYYRRPDVDYFQKTGIEVTTITLV